MFQSDLAAMLTHAGATGQVLAPRNLRADSNGRELNGILVQIDLSCTSDEVLGAPFQHYVAVSDTCNIECHFCPRQSYYGDRWENGFMQLDLFIAKLLPLVRRAALMGLYGLGEPFLHRHFFDFVTASKQAGARTLTNNHGMSLKPKIIEKILASGLDQLNVSMDGATEETFNLLRGGADFDTVCRQVKDLVTRRDAARSETPHVYIAAMVNRQNVRELPDIVRMARELGAEQVDFSDTVICDGADLEDSVSGLPVMWERIVEAKEVGREIGVRVEYSLQKPFPWRPFRPDELEPQPQVCELAWSTWLVGKSGEVKPCCFVEFEYGNAFTQEPEEIANSEVARWLRRKLMSGDLPRECRGCGCAQPLTEKWQRQSLDKAEALIEQSDLPDANRARLRAIVAERRALIDERWGS
jgi:MoaA/NifB/PqqE/SkfB family radical SAM enzyme